MCSSDLSRIGLRQCLGVDAAIGAPVTAMKHQSDRPIFQNFTEADELASLVAQQKPGHRIARLWTSFAGAIPRQPIHKLVDERGVTRIQGAGNFGKMRKPFIQRCVHVAALLERFFKNFVCWPCHQCALTGGEIKIVR